MAGYIGNHSSVVTSGVENKTTFNITESTSDLTGLAYTPHRVHVFHNGVRLVDVTDYTATNSTSIVLTTAAVSGDQIVVISYAAFAVNDTVSASTGGTFSGPISVTGNTSVTGNIAVTGTVDGRDVAADGALAASALQPNGDGSNLTGISTEPHKYQYIGSITYAVTVASYLGANRYYLDGVVYPVLALRRGNVYTFDLSNSSNSGHPLRFKNADDSSYSVGVVVTGTPGQSGAKVTLTVAANAPNALKYYCTVHGNGMGNTIGVTAGGVLNVGTFNYFNQNALTSDTTVSFASVPTNAKWQYSYKAAVNIAAAPNTDSLRAGTEGVMDALLGSSTVQSVFLSPDGTKIYLCDSSNQYTIQGTLTTPFDISTAVATSKQLNDSARTGEPRDARFSPDGTKLYVLSEDVAIFQYNVSTAFDLSTATYANKTYTNIQSDPRSIRFSPDGTKMYYLSGGTNYIYQFSLSSAFDISTASDDSKNLNTTRTVDSFSITAGKGFVIKTDGTQLIVTGRGTRPDSGPAMELHTYTMSTAFDLSTASFTRRANGHVTGSTTFGQVNSMQLVNNDTLLVFSNFNTTRTKTLNVAPMFTHSLPSSVDKTPTALASGKRATYTFLTDDGGTTVDLIAEDIV